MNPLALIHPDMLEDLPQFFSSTCTIQSLTVSADTYFDEVDSWSTLHTAIPCAIAFPGLKGGGMEVKRSDMTYVVASHIVDLAGYYPDITETMRAVVGSLTLDILLVQADSHHKMTRLTCQVVTV